MKYITKIIVDDLDQFFLIDYINKIEINDLIIKNIASKKISLYREQILEIPLLMETIINKNKNNIIFLNLNETDVIKYNSPAIAYYYCELVSNKKNSNLEPIILKSPEYSYLYAMDIIGGRWEESENTIIKDLDYAMKYASEVSKQRWKELEDAIIDDIELCINYASQVIRGRWPEIEKRILEDPEYTYRYIRDVIQGRWPEVEPFIMNTKYRNVYLQFLAFSGIKIDELLKEYPK